MLKSLYQYSLVALEKLDSRDTFTKRLGYKFAYKVYIRSYKELFGMSPYDKRAMDDHDRYQDYHEYKIRMSMDDEF